MTFDTQKNLVLSRGAAHAKCLIHGTSIEDRDYLVVSNFACSDDRAELASEALESDGPSLDSGHALTSWMT